MPASSDLVCLGVMQMRLQGCWMGQSAAGAGLGDPAQGGPGSHPTRTWRALPILAAAGPGAERPTLVIPKHLVAGASQMIIVGDL